jgi:hypothetical protein
VGASSSSDKENKQMNRILIAGASAIMATSVAAGGMMLAGPASAASSRAARPAAAASCKATHHNYQFPSKPTLYQAGAAGSVTIAPVNKGTIRVAKVHTAPGYRASVDSSRGSSVDVYFSGHHGRLKFEAEINDAGGLTVTVTTCH